MTYLSHRTLGFYTGRTMRQSRYHPALVSPLYPAKAPAILEKSFLINVL